MEDLIELAAADSEELLAGAGPALRATLERQLKEPAFYGFNSFIDAG
ncbi:MAG: hypothetical protein HOQ24_08580 [Mycobacteriaceae bacterium]|nr:hypothetical protein [Mycobacteriaceae bacterium]